jgi:alkylation response protein AidB-like acyl-CoA dehydrogenase
MPSHLDALDGVIRDVVAPSAVEIDRSGSFPSAAVQALGKAGLLGLTSAADVGGMGLGLDAAAEVIERLASACSSTAMVTLMHYSAVGVIEALGPRDVREAIARGDHLTTLAFSEAGSRSQFWTPMGTAKKVAGGVQLDAQKSWVTSAARADSYVWSSKPLAAEGPMTLWYVPSKTAGISQSGGFDGLGLRGNGSTPVTASGAVVPETAMLGEDGKGLDSALMLVVPAFQVLSAAFGIGIMEAVIAEASQHLTKARYEHLDRTLGEGLLPRLDLARMRLAADRERALLNDTLIALNTQRPDAMLRVLETKASAAETSLVVTDLAMKVCGGSAFRKELGVERRFRDARAARVMAPTTDALLDFIGRSLLGQPLIDAATP